MACFVPNRGAKIIFIDIHTICYCKKKISCFFFFCSHSEYFQNMNFFLKKIDVISTKLQLLLTCWQLIYKAFKRAVYYITIIYYLFVILLIFCNIILEKNYIFKSIFRWKRSSIWTIFLLQWIVTTIFDFLSFFGQPDPMYEPISKT